MKIRPFSLIAAPVLALALPVLAQESTTTPAPATPSPSPAATAAPSPTPAPSPAAAPAADEPTLQPTPGPSPSASPADSADILPEPSDVNLGAPVEGIEPLPADAVAPSDLPNPDALIPEGVDPTSSEAPPPPAIAQENQYEKERKLLVRYQQVRLQVLKDPAVRSLREQAEAAKTDEGKRQALREYYRLLYGKMTAIDSALAAKCDSMLQAYLRRLGQFRVTPAIPLNPPPTPAPLKD